MNYRLRRFIETTLPMVILYGITIVVSTKLLGPNYGLLGVLVFTILDVILTKKKDMIPTYIEYDNKCFPTLTELIEYVKKRKQQ